MTQAKLGGMAAIIAKAQLTKAADVPRPKVEKEKPVRAYPDLANVKTVADAAIDSTKDDYGKLVIASLATAICSNPAKNGSGFYPAVMLSGIKAAYKVITGQKPDDDILAAAIADLVKAGVVIAATAYGWKSGYSLAGLSAFCQAPKSSKFTDAALALGYGAVQ